MTRLYLMVLIVVLIIGAYFYGLNISNAKCRATNLQNDLINIQQIQQSQRMINESVYKTGLGDIRRILRDKYSIAQ